MNEYNVPDFPDYCVTEDGVIISYREDQPKRKNPTRKRKVLKSSLKKPKNNYGVKLSNETEARQILLQKIVAAAKYGRWPKDFEEVRHRDGDRCNNAMSNVELGDHLNNIIDCLELGARQTTPEYLDLAIARLMDLRASME